MVLSAVWLVRFALAAIRRRLRLGPGEWARWTATAAAVGLIFVVNYSDLPYQWRLTLSRSGMDQAAAEIVAGGSLDRGWIGLYPVDRVERTENGMRFLIGGLMGSGFLDPIGFAWSRSGPPPTIGEDIYAPLDGGWWYWRESW